MAWQTGSAQSFTDLANQLAPLLQSQGWGIDLHQTVRSSYVDANDYLCFHRADVGYFIFRIDDRGINSTAFTGINGNLLLTKVLGGVNYQDINYDALIDISYGSGIAEYEDTPVVSYDFFVTPRYCHIVLLNSQGVYSHSGFGMLNKEGNFNGGQYQYHAKKVSLLGSGNNKSYLRLDMPGEAEGWMGFSAGYQDDYPRLIGSGPGNDNPDALTVASSLSQFGNVIAPVSMAVIFRNSEKFYRRLGVIPDVAVCRMKDISARTVLTVNGERWMMVPGVSQVGVNDDYYGYAYKVDA
ncbi:hypothetical protein AAE121_004888 [Salmonella enterica]